MSADQVSVVHLLWGEERRAGDALERELLKAKVSGSARAKAGVAGSGRLDQRISGVVLDAVNVDLGGIVIDAWTGYRALREAGERTRNTPGQVDVELAEHEITSTHQPLVDILINGNQVDRLTFELVLTLTLRSVVAVVERGALVAVGGGSVAAKAALELNGRTLAKGEKTVLPNAVVRLGDGIPLVGPATPAGSGPTTATAGRTAAATPTAATPTAATPTAATTSPAGTPSWVHKVSPTVPPAPAPSPSPAPAGVPWWERTTPSGGSR